MAVPSVRMFAPLMTQRVSVSHLTGYDEFGAPAYGSAAVYQAAVAGEMKLVQTPQGQEAPSHQQVYLMSNAAVRPHPESKVTLSTGDAGSTEPYALSPPILAVGRYPFLSGQYVTVIYLGNVRTQ